MCVCVGCLLVVAWAYGRLSHARGHPAYRLTGFTPRQRPSRSTTNKQRTHSTNHASNHPSISHPSVHPLTHRSIHPSIRSSTHPIIHASTSPSIYPIDPFSLSINTSSQPSIHRHTRPSTHMQSLMGGRIGIHLSHLAKGKIVAANHIIGYL